MISCLAVRPIFRFHLRSFVTNKSDGPVLLFLKARCEIEGDHARRRTTDISDKVGDGELQSSSY